MVGRTPTSVTRSLFAQIFPQEELGPGGTHTSESHGATVARKHMYDWLKLLFIMVIDVGLHGTNPMKDNTLPAWVVPVFAVVLPILIFLLCYSHRKDLYNLHHSILGLLFAVLVTGVLTDAIGNAVGRPRPGFFLRCFPDGNDNYDRCGSFGFHGEDSVIKGHNSFPMGRTSRSFSGLGFLSLFLSGETNALDRRENALKLCIVFLPLLIASLISISRVDDYWHKWKDVFAGALLGLVVATFCYLQFFLPSYHIVGNSSNWLPMHRLKDIILSMYSWFSGRANPDTGHFFEFH